MSNCSFAFAAIMVLYLALFCVAGRRNDGQVDVYLACGRFCAGAQILDCALQASNLRICVDQLPRACIAHRLDVRGRSDGRGGVHSRIHCAGKAWQARSGRRRRPSRAALFCRCDVFGHGVMLVAAWYRPRRKLLSICGNSLSCDVRFCRRRSDKTLEMDNCVFHPILLLRSVVAGNMREEGRGRDFSIFDWAGGPRLPKATNGEYEHE